MFVIEHLTAAAEDAASSSPQSSIKSFGQQFTIGVEIPNKSPS